MGWGGRAWGKEQSETAPHHVILAVLVHPVPALCHPPMALLLQRFPVSQCCNSTSLRSNPFA